MDELQSRLPSFKAKRSQDFPAFLIVTCGYDDCPSAKADRPFLVAEKVWMAAQVLERIPPTGKPITVMGRSCPYCFRTGRLPRRGGIR